MKRGTSYQPDGPLTLGDLRQIIADHYSDGITGVPGAYLSDCQVVEIRTPMNGDRRQVTLTVTDERFGPKAPVTQQAAQQETTTEGEQSHG